MNKQYYKSAFSSVRPSEEVSERILEMTNTKKRIHISKSIFAFAAILSILMCSIIAADAASDGAISQNVKDTVNDTAQKVTYFINGKKVSETEAGYTSAFDGHTMEIIDKDGNKVAEATFEDVEDVSGVDYGVVFYEIDTNGDDIVFAISDSEVEAVPTTAPAQ